MRVVFFKNLIYLSLIVVIRAFIGIGPLDNDSCVPFGSGCTSNGLAHLYSMFHFNGRYRGDERLRIPFSIALNAAIPGAI